MAFSPEKVRYIEAGDENAAVEKFIEDMAYLDHGDIACPATVVCNGTTYSVEIETTYRAVITDSRKSES